MMVKPATSNLDASPPLPARPVSAQQVRRSARLPDRCAKVSKTRSRSIRCIRPLTRAWQKRAPRSATRRSCRRRRRGKAALEAAEHAVTLDPSLPEAHTALGWTKTLFAIDMRSAERDFQRALEIAPGYAPAHGYYALLLCGFRRFDEAIDRHAGPPSRSAVDDDAVHHEPGADLRAPLRRSRTPDARDPVNRSQLRRLLLVSEQRARRSRQADEAIEVQEKGVALVHRAPFFVALLRPLSHCREGPARGG